MDLEKLVVKVMAETTDAQTKLKKLQDEVKKTSDTAEKDLSSVGKNSNSGLSKTLKHVRAMNDAVKAFGRNAKLNAGLIKPTDGFIKLSEKIVEADASLNTFRDRLDTLDQTSAEFNELSSAISEAESVIEGMNDALNEAVRTGSAFEDVQPPSFIKNLGAYVREGVSELRNVTPASAGLQKVTDLMRRIGSTAGSAGGGVKKFAQGIINDTKVAVGWLAKLKSGFGTVLSRIPLLGKSARAATGGVDSLFKGLRGLWNIAKMFVIGQGIAGWINATKEGFNNLSAYSANTRASLTSLQASLMTLKNAFATAFAPILDFVAPVLAKLIDWCTAAMTAVAHLFAALTGKSTVVIARKATAGVASGVGNIGSSADSAKGSVDDLKRSLMGFDQINKLDDQGSSGSGGSGGGGGGGGVGGAGSMFDTVEVSGEAIALADAIKEAWANADFTEIGEMVGAKLNNALNNIPWDKIQETSRKIAKSIATFLNGFISETDWNLVGKTISEGINTAIYFAETFVTTFDWGNFGKSMMQMMISAVKNVDWSALATTIGGLVGGISKALWEALKELGSQIAPGFEEGIWEGIKGIGKWIKDNIFQPFIDGFKKAFGIASPATTMKPIGQNIILGVLAGVKEKVTDVINWFKNLPSTIRNAVGSLDIVATIKGATDKTFTNVKEAFAALKNSTVVKTISGATAKAFTTVKDAFDALKNATATKTISGTTAKAFNTVKKAFNDLKSNTATKTITGVKAKAWAGIKKTWDSIKSGKATKTINAKITGLTKALKKFFGLKAGGGVYSGGRWHPVTSYAAGGVPDSGQMFIAREAGPELVGTIGGHTAVMNNDQIVSSVSNGVYRAVLAAMSQSGSGTTPVVVMLEGDAKKMFRIMQKEAQDYTDTTGLSPFPV